MTTLCLALALLVPGLGLAQSITTLADGLNRSWNLAVDGTYVYWVENDISNGAVKKVPVNGGTITTLASGLVQPSAIEVDANYVYWIERNGGSNGSLKKIPKTGGSITTLAAGFLNAQNHMALDASNVYWGDGKSGGGGVIKKVSKNGGTVTTLVSEGILSMETAIAVDASYVYFTDDLNNIKKVPINGGTVTTVGTGNPSELILYANNLYWVEFSGTVKKMPNTGGTATTLASGSNSPAGIATDGTNIYWLEFTNPGTVRKVPISGGTVTTIATQANTIGIAVDNESVYWTVSVYLNQGKVQKYPLFPPPTVYTSSVSSITVSSATLNGSVNPNGATTTAWFQWGTTPSYGYNTTTSSLGSGTNSVAFNKSLTGLTASTYYYYRAVAQNSAGTSYEAQRSFTTASPTVYFSSASSSGYEGTATATFQLFSSAVSSQNVSVNYTITSGTATGGGVDYSMASGTATIYAGQTTATSISATIIEDALNENNETFTVTISNPVNATLGAITSHTYTILDNDSPPAVAFSSASSSGAESITPATFPFTISAVSGLDISVNYTVGGTATGGGIDYTLAAGTATITAGNTTTNIIATIVDDALDENNETIVVTLSNPTNATLGAATVHTYTILDNDDLPPVAPTGLAVTGVGGTTVSLSWDANSEADFLRYRVYQSEDQTNWTPVDSTGDSLPLDTTATITGLTAQLYYFHVTAVDDALNESVASNKVSVTPQAAGTAPTVITGLPARITATAARLRGSVNPQGLSTDAIFEWGTGWGTGTADTNVVVAAQNLAGAADTTVGARLIDLAPGTTYDYRVVGTSSAGTTTGADVTFVTPTDTTVIVDNRIVTGDVAVTFPGAGILLDFTFTGTPGTNVIEVKRFRAAPDGVLPTELALFANRYWEFNHTGPGTFSVDITLNLGIAGVNSGNLAGDIRLLHRGSGGTGTWTVLVQEAFALGDSTITFSDITSFSQFTVAKFEDIRPPTISNIVLVHSGDVEPGTALDVTADVTDNLGVDQVTLHVAKGGDSDFATPLVMTDDGSGTYSATIPTTAVTFRGLIYFIRASDAADNADTSAVEFIPVTFASGDLSITNLSSSAYSSGFPRDVWRLLSVPATLSFPAVSAAIGDELGDQTNKTWRIFRYGNGNYIENPTNFVPGTAYWLYQQVEDNIAFDVGSGESFDLQAASITVGAQQWQLIGNPYPFTVSVTANQNIFGPLSYQGDGGSDGWFEVTQLRPWGGYAVFNKTDSPRQVRLRVTPLAKGLQKTVSDPLAVPGWTLQLAAVGETYRDGVNAVGRRAGATEQLDIHDDPEPPYIDGYISLAMERPEWGTNLPRWTSDIRSLQESDGVWDMALYTKGESGPIRLSADLQGDFPPDGRIVILDVITRQVVDLLPGSAPLVITGYRENFPYHLKVVAGSPSYVESTTEEILASLPDAFALQQNYPNPFNPTTRLEYSVFRPARVSLKIYNILGQELVTLADGWKDLGRYTVSWNGRDRFGSPLASGVYFAIYTAEGHSMTRKMVMMK